MYTYLITFLYTHNNSNVIYIHLKFDDIYILIKFEHLLYSWISSKQIGQYTSSNLQMNIDLYGSSRSISLGEVPSSSCTMGATCVCQLVGGSTWKFTPSPVLNPTNVRVCGCIYFWYLNIYRMVICFVVFIFYAFSMTHSHLIQWEIL